MQDRNPYPSTYDAMNGMPPIAGGQEDDVLATMEAALERIQNGWTSGDYIAGKGGDVCAVGAILAVDNEDRYLYENDRGFDEKFSSYLERTLSESAREAVALLDASALELYPNSERYRVYGNIGPLEYVNQHKGFSEVVEVYQHAIEKRKGALVH